VDYTSLTKDPDAWLAGQIAAGQYGYANEHITAANFPIRGTGVVKSEIILVHLDRGISSDDAVAELDRLGLEPAKLEHATAFGAKYPDVQRKYSIVFLGASWVGSNGYRRVPCLVYCHDGRELGLGWWRDGWGRGYRFAAVRKSPVL
jgi:hypothetical protein